MSAKGTCRLGGQVAHDAAECAEYPACSMAKKAKLPDAPKPTASGALKHNPFAALGAQKVDLAADARTSEPHGPAHGSLETSEQPRAQAEAGAPRPHLEREQAGQGARPRNAAPADKAKSRGRLVLRRETKHRGGKAVVIVRGLDALKDFDEAKVAELAKQLKQKLGCGGTVERGDGETEIVLQGDRAAKVAELLRAQGFRVDGVTS
jgi:predicted translation initiation factor SUI1